MINKCSQYAQQHFGLLFWIIRPSCILVRNTPKNKSSIFLWSRIRCWCMKQIFANILNFIPVCHQVQFFLFSIFWEITNKTCVFQMKRSVTLRSRPFFFIPRNILELIIIKLNTVQVCVWRRDGGWTQF